MSLFRIHPRHIAPLLPPEPPKNPDQPLNPSSPWAPIIPPGVPDSKVDPAPADPSKLPLNIDGSVSKRPFLIYGGAVLGFYMLVRTLG